MTEAVPFRVVTTIPQLNGNESMRAQMYIKDLWAEKINGKQIECNASVLAMTEVMREVPIQVLTNPAFAEGGSTQRPAPMVIYIVKPEDRLWDIAKKYSSCRQTLCSLNGWSEETAAVGDGPVVIG